MSADISAAPDLSIITVCRNASDTLERCISSVQPLLQNHPVRTEYIVIDGASTDGTADMLRRAQETGRITRCISEPDNGIYDAMNKGLRLAAGKVCVFINADDEICPEAAEACCRPILDGEADYTVSTAKVANERGDFKFYRKPDFSVIWFGVPYCHQTLYCNTETLRTMGGFRTNFSIAADADLIGRLYKQNLPYSIVNQVSAIFRQGGLSSEEAVHGELLTIILQWHEDILALASQDAGYTQAAIKTLRYQFVRYMQSSSADRQLTQPVCLLHAQLAQYLPNKKRLKLKKRYRRKSFISKLRAFFSAKKRNKIQKKAEAYSLLSDAV